MKKVKLIYNPMSGNKKFPNKLDKFIQKFQAKGYETRIFRSARAGDLEKGLRGVNSKQYHSIVVAGGDGSVNEVIHKMLENNINLPLGIIPAGTANDFANHLNIADNIDQAMDTILNNNIKQVDVGQVNGRYFINVCAGGLLVNVSHQIDVKVKNTLGKLGYYIKGIEQLPNFESIPLEIKTSQQTIQDEFYLFLVLNGKSAGGFNKLAPEAKIDDGLFDFIGVKARPLHEIARLFVKILQGRHIADENIVHLKDSSFKIKTLQQRYQNHISDIDGEKGPSFPLDISLYPQELEVFSNN